jgi:LL-diaminopimelate aminotransferase
MNMIANLIADRLGGSGFGANTLLNKFSLIKQAKAETRAVNPGLPLIDLGVGEPDLAADPEIVAILAREAGKPENRWYADNGIAEFQEAAAGYLDRVYGVNGLNPATQILHGIGSKSILALLPLCFINPGDLILATTPGYPIAATYTRYLGGEVYYLPLRKENNFYPNFEAIPEEILQRVKMLYINYPNNPTGQTATGEFYREVVDFATRNRIMVIADTAYGALTYPGYRPLSFLSVAGAAEVGVELHSLSKAFNMTGWRLAFAAGNPEIIKAYGMVKDNTDSGQFRAIQKAGVYALNHPELTLQNCERYSRRFDLLVPALREAGFAAVKPRASFYCYAPSPRGTKNGIAFNSAQAAAEYLLKNALISTVPWDEAGPYLRMSVTFEADGVEAEQAVVDDLKERLLGLELVF